jgi:hypothetical protein
MLVDSCPHARICDTCLRDDISENATIPEFASTALSNIYTVRLFARITLANAELANIVPVSVPACAAPGSEDRRHLRRTVSHPRKPI